MRMKAGSAAGSSQPPNNCRQQACKQTSKAYALLLLCILRAPAAVAGSCVAPAGADKIFIDPSTPDTACTKTLCVESYAKCCGGGADSCAGGGPTEDLQLVFSDEFTSYPGGLLGTPGDVRWTAMDFHYSSDKNEWQNYKPEQVMVQDGQLLLILDDKNSSAVRHGVAGSVSAPTLATDVVYANKTSGMVQSWNKFCFTGGYVEFSVKLPGTAQQSGFWAATWLMGNLGRAGYYPSLEGMWPFSYDACENGDQAHDWNSNKTQRINRCNGRQGRGAPEIDVLEYGKLGANGGLPTYVHTMQMGPVLPPYTSWYSADGTSGEGIRMPGKGTDFETHLPDYRGALSRDGYPRTGSTVTDTYTGSSYLKGDTWFSEHHTYAVLWEPGEYVRWYVDDLLLFEVGKEALARKTSKEGLTVEQRLIPKEPSYLIMNLAMSNNAWAKVDEDLTYPGVMSVEHVRVWQRPGAINVGCDPSAVTADAESFRTAEYISCNRDWYVPESEQGQWRFTYCSAFQSQENQFLLGLAISCAAVTAIAVVLMLLMRRSFMRQQQLQDQVGHNLPAGITPERTPQQKMKDCYLSKPGPDLQEMLRFTRPGLLAVAEAQLKQQQDAAAAKAAAAGAKGS